ncbi:hypothetical protein GQ42DRAFT_181447 [Ramicandelaber brevisporus]|nr:hypothetical protein GQ42DRAFT_181447 [Ramicandelaber brevisporus]
MKVHFAAAAIIGTLALSTVAVADMVCLKNFNVETICNNRRAKCNTLLFKAISTDCSDGKAIDLAKLVDGGPCELPDPDCIKQLAPLVQNYDGSSVCPKTPEYPTPKEGCTIQVGSLICI